MLTRCQKLELEHFSQTTVSIADNEGRESRRATLNISNSVTKGRYLSCFIARLPISFLIRFTRTVIHWPQLKIDRSSFVMSRLARVRPRSGPVTEGAFSMWIASRAKARVN